MNTITNTSPRQASVVIPAQVAGIATLGASTTASVARTNTAATSDTVELSGDTLLQSRLFPGVADVSPAAVQASSSIYKFLTSSDRTVLSNLYKTTSDSGGDLKQVDALAFDLANYRSTPTAGDKVGTTFTEAGTPIDYAFTPSDEAAAQRILTSKAMSDTAIPKDFLKSFLDPGFAPGDHAVSFDALEKMVYATSTSGADGATDPTAVLAPRPAERLATLKAAGTLTAPPITDTAAASSQPQAFVGLTASTPAARGAALLTLLDDGPSTAKTTEPQDVRHSSVTNKETVLKPSHRETPGTAGDRAEYIHSVHRSPGVSSLWIQENTAQLTGTPTLQTSL